MGYKERPKEEGEIGWEPKARNAMFFGGFFFKSRIMENNLSCCEQKLLNY